MEGPVPPDERGKSLSWVYGWLMWCMVQAEDGQWLQDRGVRERETIPTAQSCEPSTCSGTLCTESGLG